MAKSVERMSIVSVEAGCTIVFVKAGEEAYLWMRCSLNCRLVDVDYDRLRLGSVAVSTNVFVIYR